ncbi:MAG: cyclic nucleotide-binding domain-containing protein [Treponema sp.]|jgi:diguanylate cyclase (GGDEF)-like protein|nr:cyclic nucleotide-binding domain-containing protein [Treponema sp.]
MDAVNVEPALIQKVELFSSLEQNEIDFVVSHSGLINLPKNDLLFSSGEKAAQFYILTSGEIRVFNKKEDGSEEEMARFTAGDTIGDFDFARGAEYDAYAEAGEDSALIVFPLAGFTIDSLAREDPHSVCSILLSAINMMTGRIKSTHKLILNNMSWVQELHRRAYEDAGTGLWKQTLINDEIINALNESAALIMLKPDRFKILVDSRGHSAGDEAMIRIAIILKNITRQIGHGWALRFKSNEVGLIINNCTAEQAEKIAHELFDFIRDMDAVPSQNDIPEFNFSATVSWAVWPNDEAEWETLFNGNYSSLLDNWKDGGNRIVHYSKKAEGI